LNDSLPDFLNARSRHGASPAAVPVALMCALLLAMGGCAQMGARAGGEDAAPQSQPAAQPLAPTAEPPPPPVNLSGFPLTYRQGYADGCATATGPERRDNARYSADGNYRTGWQDGLALCRKK